MFVNVALNIPHDKVFTYEVPQNLENLIEVGKRVFVPFGSRKRTGFVVAVKTSCDLTRVKSVLEILDEEPLFNQNDLEFYQWICDYYIYPLGKALAEIIPSGTEKKDVLWIIPTSFPEGIKLSPTQEKVLAVLQNYPQGVTLKALAQECKITNAASAVRSLHLLGLLRLEEKQKKQLSVRTEKICSLASNKLNGVKFTAKQNTVIDFLEKHGPCSTARLIMSTNVSASVIAGLFKKGFLEFNTAEVIRRASLDSALNRYDKEIELNKEQQSALSKIFSCLEKNDFTAVLLHGITGSGKTEVYLKAIEKVLNGGGTAMYLVPEIALTPQLISRISGRFDEGKIAVLHSGISESVRYDQWRQIKRGQIQLVIGARSAVFAPLPNLKLIIVDEEHDSSYKQDDRLCYHARDLAVVKAKNNRAIALLGSATPSLRTYFNAQTKKYLYLELTGRVQNRPLPMVEIIDMKSQKEKQGKMPLLSNNLIAAIMETLKNKEQILLFLNKRGFDTFLVCADCGYNFHCPNCSVSLKHHLSENIIKCHYCGFQQKALPVCPSCGGSRVRSYGAGTQKLEKEIEKLFPAARVQRMDSDTSSRDGAYEKILKDLEEKKIDILIGTQMIAKGHDFPFITLVGVVAADTSLNMPDFRAAEKTFQILTQVAGRGGRGDNPGKVIIQTFNPGHDALLNAKNHDYKSFYNDELKFRQELQYPPFGHIINIRLSSVKKDAVISESKTLAKRTKGITETHNNSVEIIGPAPAPLAKLNGRFRFQMLIKGANMNTLRLVARELLQKHKNSFVKMSVDIDPENFM
jgi:primosomal protein N' (replication factor Y)